jgi:hypothetical protein
MPFQNRPHTAGHFELTIDGHVSTAYLKAVDGGHIKTAVMDEPIGPENLRIKHGSVSEIEPISLEIGLSGGTDILKWIQGSWNKEFSRRNGMITHADFDLYKTFEHEFMDALITETTFPTLDGGSKDAAYLKIKIQPEHVVTKKATGSGRVSSNLGTKQKLWTASSFRLEIDGIPEFEQVNKIDSFTIKQGIKKLYTGEEKLPQIEPTKIEFPHITGTLALHWADKLIKWHEETNVNRVGSADPKVQKHGSLTFLGPDRKSVLFRIELYHVGLHNLTVMPSTANSDQIKRAKFELFVGSMEIDGKGPLGLE